MQKTTSLENKFSYFFGALALVFSLLGVLGAGIFVGKRYL